MIKKRFTIENIGNMFRVLDNTEPITTEFENWDKNDIKNLVELLNNLNDENKQLKSENEDMGRLIDDMKRLIDNISYQRDEFHRGARENANRVGKLKKENEKLKSRVDNLTELNSIYVDFMVNEGYELADVMGKR